MRRLHTKVNLIPVIAKADTLTDDEVTAFKRRVSRFGFSNLRDGPILTKPNLLWRVDLGRYSSPSNPDLPAACV
jgi:hypothetical protein